jgi:hypothetical protein
MSKKRDEGVRSRWPKKALTPIRDWSAFLSSSGIGSMDLTVKCTKEKETRKNEGMLERTWKRNKKTKNTNSPFSNKIVRLNSREQIGMLRPCKSIRCTPFLSREEVGMRPDTKETCCGEDGLRGVRRVRGHKEKMRL